MPKQKMERSTSRVGKRQIRSPSTSQPTSAGDAKPMGPKRPRGTAFASGSPDHKNGRPYQRQGSGRKPRPWLNIGDKNGIKKEQDTADLGWGYPGQGKGYGLLGEDS
eukprot:gene14812-20867_t